MHLNKYNEAAVEIEKYVFVSSFSANEQADLYFKKTECYKHLNNFNEALNTLDKINLSLIDEQHQYETRYQMALCNYLDGKYKECNSMIQQLNYFTKDTLKKQQYLFLDILNLNELHDWKTASIKWKEYLKYKNLHADSLQNFYKKYPILKNAKKAELLALIIPGSGLMYAGKIGEGITAFILQTSFLAAGVYLIFKHYYVTGFFVGPGLFTTFHQGSLKLTEKRITERNERVATIFNNHIKNNILNIERK
jgi:tetratricopeptide (TPR) repeat protein